MNAALAVHKQYAYVGSRTDGKNGNANNAGVMVVDVAGPGEAVHRAPDGAAVRGQPRESSRELRVWRSQEVLIVLHTNCGGDDRAPVLDPEPLELHASTTSRARTPRRRSCCTRTPWTRTSSSSGRTRRTRSARCCSPPARAAELQIYDLSPLLEGRGKEPGTAPAPVRTFDGAHGFGNSSGSGIHSFSVSNDGKRGYFALLTRGFGVVDFTDFTDNDPATNTYRTITPTANRPTWPGPGAHSAVKLWNQDWVYVSDEVYGTADRQRSRLPVGLDALRSTSPTRRGRWCAATSGWRRTSRSRATNFNPPRTSYSAHNPTLTPSIAFSTWHSGGFQAMDITNPTNVTQLAEFKPEPLATGRHRGPAPVRRDRGPGERMDKKVVMWSYPVIQDGLIYTVDLRNGLYILKYNGPYSHEVDSVGFLEGNSNQGDALCYEPVPGAPAPTARRRSTTPGGAGGTVPATLSLTLGANASFGAFIPGVAREYTAIDDGERDLQRR